MASRVLATAFVGLLFVSSCGGGGGEDCPDPSTNVVLGCPSYACEGQASGDDAAAVDTYASFATSFFEGYCTRCHSTERTLTMNCAMSAPDECRNGAPEGHDWNSPSSIRAHLPEIRTMVGELNLMPVSAPFPSCDERRRLTAWIDEGAPGLP